MKSAMKHMRKRRVKDLTNSVFLNYDFNANDSAGINMIKVKNRNTTTRCEICSKLTIKTPE